MIKLLCQMISQIFYFVSERETQGIARKKHSQLQVATLPCGVLTSKEKLDQELQINFVNVIIFVL